MGKSTSTSPSSPSATPAATSSSSTSEPKKEESTSKSEPESKQSTNESLRESSYEVKVTLADQQADPNSPLYSAKSFDQLGLHPDLLKGIYAMKYQKPSKIQERALPLLLQNP